MEFVVLMCFLMGLLIIMIPNREVRHEIIEDFKNPDKCKLHKWVSKDSGIDACSYTVCENCHWVPEINGYEPHFKG